MEFIRNFQKQAEADPGRTVLVDCGDNSVLTYGELDLLSGKVYRYLKERGIGREDFVNVLLPRGVTPYIAMLGV